jgi:hypothetical protein
MFPSMLVLVSMTLVEHDKKKSYQDFKIHIFFNKKFGVGKERTLFFLGSFLI